MVDQATDDDDAVAVVVACELVVALTGLLAHVPWRNLAADSRNSRFQIEVGHGVREGLVLLAALQRHAL